MTKAIKYGVVSFLILAVFAIAGILLLRGPSGAPTDDLPPAAALDPQLSTIDMPITISLEQLRQLAEAGLSGEIYQEDREIATGVAIDIRVRRRNEPIQMDMVSSWLTTTIPLTVTGTPNLDLGPFRLPGASAGGLDADIDVDLRTRVHMNPDWSIAAESTADFNVGRADLTIAGRVTDMTAIVTEILDRNVNRVTAPLESYLENLDVLSMMEPVWEQFRSPIQISEEPSVWLRVRPQRFTLSPPDTQADSVRFDIGAEMYLDSVVGARPADVQLGPIPALGEATDTDASFSVAIPISLQLEEATRILSERMAGREDRIGDGARVRWQGVKLGGTGDRLRIAVTFEAETGMPVVGLLSGEMVLEGRPRYDPETRTLTMRNVDYTLSSDSVLAGIADWLLHDRLRERIQEELVFPMADLIEGIRQDLQSELESVSFGDYGNAEARVDSLAPSLLNVSDEALELAVVADGTLRLSLNLLATFNRLR